jgi:hypothetical protein
MCNWNWCIKLELTNVHWRIYDESECSSGWLDHDVGAIGYGNEGGIN